MTNNTPEYNRRYYQENKEKWQAQYRKPGYHKEYQAQNRERLNEYRRAFRHGLTIEEMQNLLQAKTCAICEREFGESVKQHIDHCHTTGKIRGVLCPSCNTAIGKFQDSIEILKKAIAYLDTKDE